MPRDNNYVVSVGHDHVTVTKKYNRALVAKILEREIRPEQGLQVLYLDRLVCPTGDIDLNEHWSATGCVSSILTGPLTQE